MRELSRTLEEYKRESRKSWPVILTKQASEFASNSQCSLYTELGGKSPSDRLQRSAKIEVDAKARNFAMGRRQNQLVQARSGISDAAWRIAGRMIPEGKSELFETSSDGRLLPIRFSKRGDTRVIRRNRGGRYKASQGMLASEIAKDRVDAALAKYGGRVRRLNLRQVASYCEMRLRMLAAKGGTMSVQWLPKVWRRIGGAIKGSRVLVQNKRGATLSLVRDATRGNNIAIAMEGFVPGTSEYVEKLNVIPRIVASRITDTREGIRKYQVDAMKKAAAKR